MDLNPTHRNLGLRVGLGSFVDTLEILYVVKRPRAA